MLNEQDIKHTMPDRCTQTRIIGIEEDYHHKHTRIFLRHAEETGFVIWDARH